MKSFKFLNGVSDIVSELRSGLLTFSYLCDCDVTAQRKIRLIREELLKVEENLLSLTVYERNKENV